MKHCLLLVALCFSAAVFSQDTRIVPNEVSEILRNDVLTQAAWALAQEPVTVTAAQSPRSAGTAHDFFSEGDYWWPDSTDRHAPYVQRDGLTNPENFVEHRRAMIRFGTIVGTLTSAWLLTKDDRYAKHALRHIRAWFVDQDTRMNPNLQYAQAIHGRATGRGIGIIDTIHLVEIAQALRLFEQKKMDPATVSGAKQWFVAYTEWLTTHPYGIDEMNARNNHGTCWVMQVAAFAKFTNNERLLTLCRERYKKTLLPEQMAADGSFPLELKRTKPYGYSIFNLDAMSMICVVLSTRSDNLWKYQTADGKSIQAGIGFLSPFLKDKSAWPYRHDVMYWDNWPVAQPSLLFGALIYANRNWYNVWKKSEHVLQVEEVIRNMPVRNPLLWLGDVVAIQ